MTTPGAITLPKASLVVTADLLYFDQPDTTGRDWFLCRAEAPDPDLYVIWIRPRPDLCPDELRAKLAIHVNHQEH